MVITLEQVLKAYDYANSHPHKYLRGTTNWCAAVAHSLNAEQPAPVAVVMPQFDMQMVMMCLGGVRGAVLTSNQCHALAQMLNACSAEVARLNGVKP